MSRVRIYAAIVRRQHRADRNLVDVQSVEAQAATITGVGDIPGPVTDVADLQQALPRRPLRNGEVPAVRVCLLVVSAVHRRGARGRSSEIERVQFRGQQGYRAATGHRDVIAKIVRGHTGRRVQTVGELTRMEVVPAPAASQDGLAGPKEVIGGAHARLIEQSPCGEPRQRDAGVLAVPFESAVVGRSRTVLVVGRLVEDRIAEPFAVRPGLEMSEADTIVDGQPPCRLPVILDETLVGIVRDIVDAVEGGFVVTA